MSTYAERSRPGYAHDFGGNRRYCRGCDQYFDGDVSDKECQVCLGIVTPEVQITSDEMLDWLDKGHVNLIKDLGTWATVEEKSTGDVLANGRSVREAIRAAMKAEAGHNLPSLPKKETKCE